MSRPGVPRPRSLGELLLYHLGWLLSPRPCLLEITEVKLVKPQASPGLPWKGAANPGSFLPGQGGGFPRGGTRRGGDESGSQGLWTT